MRSRHKADPLDSGLCAGQQPRRQNACARTHGSSGRNCVPVCNSRNRPEQRTPDRQERPEDFAATPLSPAARFNHPSGKPQPLIRNVRERPAAMQEFSTDDLVVHLLDLAEDDARGLNICPDFAPLYRRPAVFNLKRSPPPPPTHTHTYTHTCIHIWLTHLHVLVKQDVMISGDQSRLHHSDHVPDHPRPCNQC